MTNESRTTIEGGRADFAFKTVKSAKDATNIDFAKYRSYVKKIPTLIQVNGLGQTLAFYYSKNKETEYRQVYKDLHHWMKKKFPEWFSDQKVEFVEAVIGVEKNETYRMFTIEILALLNWMRRFVEGMAEKKEGE